MGQSPNCDRNEKRPPSPYLSHLFSVLTPSLLYRIVGAIMAKRPPMNRLSQILENVMKNHSLDKALEQSRILKHWESAVGPSIAAHAHPEELRSHKLYIHVDSSLWLQELTLLKPSLIAKLNAGIGKDTVGDLVLRLGRHDRLLPPKTKSGRVQSR